MNCPRCGFGNPEDMSYCGKCGEKLIGAEGDVAKKSDDQRSRLCVECGREIAWYANLCPFCGHFYGSMCLPGSPIRQPTWKSVVGGALIILSGALVFLSIFGVGYGSYYPYNYYYYGLLILIAFVLPPVAIAGGICAAVRKYWAFSLFGSICAVVISLLFFSAIYLVLSVVGLILIASSQGEFRK